LAQLVVVKELAELQKSDDLRQVCIARRPTSRPRVLLAHFVGCGNRDELEANFVSMLPAKTRRAGHTIWQME
jgi:hypothetical protein